MFGQEIKKPIPYAEPERAPNAHELALWNQAEDVAKRAVLLSYVVKLQYKNMLMIAQFAATNKIQFNEPTAVSTEQRMLAALQNIEQIRPLMDAVRNMEYGIRVSSTGNDLDIIQPEKTGFSGFIIPIALGVVALVGLIARWIYLEKEIKYVHEEYAGILNRSNAVLCKDPASKICKDWTDIKKTSGYEKREGIIDSAISTLKGAATKGVSWGLAIVIPLAAFMLLRK